MSHLSTNSEKQAPLLLIVVACIIVPTINIALVTAHRELVFRCYFVWDHYTAIIDSAITTGRDAVLDLQFKILGSAAPPDDKGVALDHGLWSNFTNHGTVFRAPIFRITLPPAKCFAIEYRAKPWLIAGERLRAIALLRDVALAGSCLRRQLQRTKSSH